MTGVGTNDHINFFSLCGYSPPTRGMSGGVAIALPSRYMGPGVLRDTVDKLLVVINGPKHLFSTTCRLNTCLFTVLTHNADLKLTLKFNLH